jgi:hypothetical protein
MGSSKTLGENTRYPGRRRGRVRCGARADQQFGLRIVSFSDLGSFRSYMRASFGDRAFHQEKEESQRHGHARKDQEAIKIGQCRGLLFA